jgi:hypothetical protein
MLTGQMTDDDHPAMNIMRKPSRFLADQAMGLIPDILTN